MKTRVWSVEILAGAILLFATAGSGWAVTVHDVSIDQSLYGHINQANVSLPPGGGGQNSCVPTAVTNSFIYLQNRYPGIYGNDLVPFDANGNVTAADLGANYMGSTSNNGTTAIGWITGKIAYVNAKAPGTTVFGSQFNPTINFLLGELQDGEDVEIGLIPNSTGIGHALTLTSLHWVDQNDNLLFDLGDSATFGGIDPAGGVAFLRSLFPGGPLGTNYYSNGAAGDSTLVFATTESPILPVPEPLTMASAFLAISSLGLYLRKRIQPGPRASA